MRPADALAMRDRLTREITDAWYREGLLDWRPDPDTGMSMPPEPTDEHARVAARVAVDVIAGQVVA